MKNFLIFSLLVISSLAVRAHDEGLSSSGSNDPTAYTGKEAPKVSSEVPEELVGVGIKEKIGDSIDLNLMVTDESGAQKPLSTYFSKHKPVILSPVYFNCPGLCNFHLNGLVDALKTVDWSPGDKFEVIALSFDPKENSKDNANVPAKKKASYMKVYARPGTENGFHFVTADEATIKKITESIGFQYKWNEKEQQWSHASAAIVVSPEGKISRYLHGILFEPRDVKLALNEAADGKVGGIVDSAMLFCFKYDNHQSKYGLQVFQLMKLAGAITVLAVALWLGTAMIQAKRENT
ncbi:MAG: SCO family protein [Pseudobdellovibrio sp.]